jgi:hypothetical protein
MQLVGHEIAQASLHEPECAVLRIGHAGIRRRGRRYQVVQKWQSAASAKKSRPRISL